MVEITDSPERDYDNMVRLQEYRADVFEEIVEANYQTFDYFENFLHDIEDNFVVHNLHKALIFKQKEEVFEMLEVLYRDYVRSVTKMEMED